MKHPDPEIDAALHHVRKLWHSLMKRDVSVEEDLVREYSAALKVLHEKGHLDRVGFKIKQVQIPDLWVEQKVVITRRTRIEGGWGMFFFSLEKILRGW